MHTYITYTAECEESSMGERICTHTHQYAIIYWSLLYIQGW